MSVDPLSAASALATIVQLIALFRQQSGTRKDLTHREFIEWLDAHRHDEIRTLITDTYHLQAQVDELLRQDQKQILSKLDAVNQISVEILARLEGFSAVTAKIMPDAGLSKQAIAVLRLLAKSQTGEVAIFPDMTSFNVDNYNFSPIEPKFFVDDMDSLASCNLVSISQTGNTPTLRLTRRGAALVSTLPPPGEEDIIYEFRKA